MSRCYVNSFMYMNFHSQEGRMFRLNILGAGGKGTVNSYVCDNRF